MDARKTSIIAACFFCLLNHSSLSFAEPPESCFKSKADYETYQIFGNEKPFWPDSSSHAYGYVGNERLAKIRQAVQNGPAKWKEIVIKYKVEVIPGGATRLDASESTTPSGNIDYLWYDDDQWEKPNAIVSGGFSTPKKPGEPVILKIRIKDRICDLEKTEEVRLPTT